MWLTALVLIIAHLVSDFVFQSDDMARNKRRPQTLLAHGGVVATTTFVAIGVEGAGAPLLLVLITHILTDAYKAWVLDKSAETSRFGKATRKLLGEYPHPFAAFIADQGVHLGVIVAVATTYPDAVNSGVLALAPANATASSAITYALVSIAALIALIPMGSIMIGIAIRDFDLERKTRKDACAEERDGFANGGRVIGWLERGLVLALVLADALTAVGFVVAAKSILRFRDADDKGRMSSEYIIIGTLMSFAWAIVVSLAAKAALSSIASP